MKILLFIDSLGAGGAQRQLVGLATMLKELDYEVKVITYHNEPFFQSILIENNVSFEYVEKANNKFYRIYYIRKAILNYAPDVIISYLEMPSIITCLCKIWGLKSKIIVSERNTTQKITFKDKIRFFLYRWADSIVPNSFSQEKFITKNFPNLTNKIKTIHNFVDLDFFSPIQKIRNDIPIIMIAASIWSPKNTLGFIEAAYLLKKNGNKFYIKWFGKTDVHLSYIKLCVDRIKELDLTDCIVLLDKTKDIKNQYLDADYFCLPSFYEGTPNAICEAISCGKPINCSDVCDNSIYVQEGVNGYLFDPKSPENIADKLEKALKTSDSLYNEFCKNSRKIAEEKLSKNVFVLMYNELINSLF